LHIPDGFLDAKTILGTYALSAGALGYSIKKTKKELNDRQIPTMGVLAAFIFAAQMVNFPIAGGTSGQAMLTTNTKDCFIGFSEAQSLVPSSTCTTFEVENIKQAVQILQQKGIEFKG